jgi:glycosyltransferase involved in cell wall biosynthesis
MRLLVVSHSAATPLNQQLYGEVVRQTGWKLSLVIPSNWINEYAKLCEPQLLSGVDAELIPVPVGKSGNVILHWYKESITRLLREKAPDVIYVNHEPYAAATAQVYLANQRSVRKPIGFYSCQNIIKRYPPPFRWTESMVFRQSSFCFPISAAVEGVLRTKGYSSRSTVLPLGIDTNFYTRSADADSLKAQLRRHPGEVLIGYVGRIVEEKGLATFLDALAQVTDFPWRLIVIGAGPYEAEFDAKAAALQLSSRITRMGFVPHQEGPRYLSALDFLVLPSETRPNWKEQFGRVIIEAMACGIPVIGSDSGEIPILIQATGGGLVFREKEPGHLADCLRQLCSDAALRARLAAQGRQAVLDRFSLATLARDFIQTVISATEPLER